ncbi:sialic acid-binding Ig-like lectin 13 [Mustelus asterias]
MQIWVFMSFMALTEAISRALPTVLLPEVVETVIGSCAVIECTFDGQVNNTNLTALWIKMGSGPLQPGATAIFDSKDPMRQQENCVGRSLFTGNIGEGECSLLIRDIRKSDEGTYQFILKFRDNSQEQAADHSMVNISVLEKPHISGSGEMIVGQKKSLTCSVRHNCPNDNIQVKWRRYNLSLPLPWYISDEASNRDERGGYRTVLSELTLIPSSHHHQAVLGCSILIDGFAISTPRIITLEIEYKPTIITGPLCTKSENGTDCTCSADANPLANMTWTINGAIITVNRSDGKIITRSLNKYQVQSSLRLNHPVQRGIVITCIATNEHGDSVSIHQLHSDGMHSWKTFSNICRGTAILVGLIAILVAAKIKMKKLEEAAHVAGRQENLVIYRSTQNTSNSESNRHTHGRKVTKPVQNEEIIYTAINV